MNHNQPVSQNAAATGTKADRAKAAKVTIHKKIPALLASDSLARAGVKGAAVVRDLQAMPKLKDSPDPTIHVWHNDTISAAINLHSQPAIGPHRLAILNMASPLRPGGGVLTGATSQEEFLCTRTTLYPSLKDEFYRLPEIGLIYTKDVLVFADASGEDLPKTQRFHVDVVTAAMLRMPDTKTGDDGEPTWAQQQDRETVILKMRMVLRALVSHGITHVVLGAWGCGAYANPLREVARCWKLVLLGSKKGRKEDWSGLRDVVFAITTPGQVEVFAQEFGL